MANILVVEDEQHLAQGLSFNLTADGHDVAVASNGQAALDCFSAALDTSSPFEVVVTDLGMPVVSGIQVANEVRALSGSVRIILLTGWGERARDEKDFPDTVNHLLGKPVRIEELRAALDS